MSRMATPVTGNPSSSVKVPHDKIAMRAYEKWVKRGHRHGSHEQDWLEAEAELKAEMGRGANNSMPNASPSRR